MYKSKKSIAGEIVKSIGLSGLNENSFSKIILKRKVNIAGATSKSDKSIWVGVINRIKHRQKISR